MGICLTTSLTTIIEIAVCESPTVTGPNVYKISHMDAFRTYSGGSVTINFVD